MACFVRLGAGGCGWWVYNVLLMNSVKAFPCLAGCVRSMILVLLMVPICALAAVEQTFDVLQIGTRTYKNVTVTTKAKNYIFILHANGMNNIKVADLPADVRAKLGYAEADSEDRKSGSNSVSTWAKQTMGKIELTQLTQLRGHDGAGSSKVTLNSAQLLPILGIGTVMYLFFSFCSMLICEKTRYKPGLLIWVPILQLLPLLRAARMPSAWFLAFLLPVINIVAFIVWSVKIAEARGKSGIVAFFLILPITTLLAYLYLAFSNAVPAPEKEKPRVEIMTLETA